ncbi:hypothetical protein sos41_03260 [Alphaproteobacteria bacterium SO-S41]|nr:hypothetical protein sos41_03260 [Alphaproteobacteria bacterium SO-S41]
MSRAFQLDEDLAARFAGIALGHVTRTYPSSLMLRVGGPEDIGVPNELTPIFHGSFDWHSCVHGYWLLARVQRLFPDNVHALRIADLFARALTTENAAGELAFLSREGNAGFERPYGWGWLLKLVAELKLTPTVEAHAAAVALQPLADLIIERLHTYLPKLTYAVRSGVHSNTAFALILALDYADAAHDTALRGLIGTRAKAWFDGDKNCPAWGEPSGEDFLSASLTEALLMRRVLVHDAFGDWLGRFFPQLADSQPSILFIPASVSDRSDGRIAHLDGLNLSRAWSWRGIADATANGAALHAAADAQLAASLPHVAGDYMGEHWLASFALLALSEGPAAGL